MKTGQIKTAGIFAATALAAALSFSPAQAGANFDVTVSGQTGDLSLSIPMSSIPIGFLGLSGNIASDVSAFSIKTDGFTFDLSNGSVSLLQFFDGKTLTGFDYTGHIGTGANKVTLAINYNFGGGLSSFELYKGNNPLRNVIESGTPQIVADVPEPSSAPLMLAGLLALGLFGFWFRRKPAEALA